MRMAGFDPGHHGPQPSPIPVLRGATWAYMDWGGRCKPATRWRMSSWSVVWDWTHMVMRLPTYPASTVLGCVEP